jgi:hypothetical protein
MATQRDHLVGGLIFDVVPALQLLLGTAGFGRNALFYSLVFLHALAALAGFGSIGFAGTYAAGAYLPDDRSEGPALAGSGAAQPGEALVQAPSGTLGLPLSGALQPGSAAAGPGDGTGDVPAPPERDDPGPAEVVPVAPDYETALRQYHAALREFEASDLDDEASKAGGEGSGSVGEVSGAVDQAPGAVDDTVLSHAEEVVVEEVVVEEVVVEEVVVAEVVVEAGPPPTSEAAELDSETEEMRRYFAHPARLWGCLLLVPFLGAGALAAQPNGKGFDHPWVFGALAVWLAATLIAGSLVVPSLHQMQAVLLKSDVPGASPAVRSSMAVRFARAGRIASRSAAVGDVLFVVALALMIFRP